MGLIKSNRPKKCINDCDIWSGTYHYKIIKRRSDKRICFECKNKENKTGGLWLILKENVKNAANKLGSIL